MLALIYTFLLFILFIKVQFRILIPNLIQIKQQSFPWSKCPFAHTFSLHIKKNNTKYF
jgi:hypothetical protein